MPVHSVYSKSFFQMAGGRTQCKVLLALMRCTIFDICLLLISTLCNTDSTVIVFIYFDNGTPG